MPVRRLDDVKAARELNLAYRPWPLIRWGSVVKTVTPYLGSFPSYHQYQCGSAPRAPVYVVPGVLPLVIFGLFPEQTIIAANVFRYFQNGQQGFLFLVLPVPRSKNSSGVVMLGYRFTNGLW